MSAYPKTPTFESVTVVLPVLNETYSLTQTVDAILESSKPYLREFLIVIADRTSPESSGGSRGSFEALRQFDPRASPRA